MRRAVDFRREKRSGAASRRCWGTFEQLSRYRQIALYLLSHMIYTDGLNTLFVVGGIYAAVTFGMDFDELLIFGIALNVTAGLGAFAFGWVDDWIGAKRTILIALAGIGALGAPSCWWIPRRCSGLSRYRWASFSARRSRPAAR